MASAISKHQTRVSFAKNCGEAMITGGKSEVEGAMGGASCAVSTLKLWKQECEEGHLPESMCPPGWQPSNKTAEVRSPRQSDPYTSEPEPVFEEPTTPQHFQRVETRHTCPKCGSSIDFHADRCTNCFVKLEWEHETPKAVKREIEFAEDSSIAVQSRSSF